MFVCMFLCMTDMELDEGELDGNFLDELNKDLGEGEIPPEVGRH